jgi:hypothetical protein
VPAGPVTVSGTSLTFEANVVLRLYDPDGNLVEDTFTTAHQTAVDERGPFEYTFDTPADRAGTWRIEAVAPDMAGPDEGPGDFVTTDDPHATFRIAGELPKRARTKIERFSPAYHAQDITVPIIAMHSVDDPVTPYGESKRLAHHLTQTRLYTVALFQHVDFIGGENGSPISAARDLITAWRFTGRLLSAQE